MHARIPLTAAAAAVALLSAPALHAQDKTLNIGVSQFAATLHPSIEPAVAKSMVLDMARRPLTTFDADWELICMLCTELPSIENGLAVLETTPEGKDGIAVTYTLQPDATWGDGTPITTEDVMFTWEVGRHEQSAFANIEAYREIYGIDVVDEKTFTLHIDKVGFRYNAVNDFRILPSIWNARSSRPGRRSTRPAPPTTPIPPIPASISAPTGSSRSNPGRSRCWSRTIPGMATRRISTGSSSGPSRTPPPWRPICCPAAST